MPVLFKNAPLVIAKRKTVNVKLLGSKISTRDDLTVEIGKQSAADIQWLLKAITLDEAQAQINLNNNPTVMLVDGKEGVHLKQATRRTEVFYGSFLDEQMIKAVRRTLTNSIKANAATAADAQLGARWKWYVTLDPNKPAIPFNIKKLKAIPRDALLVLKPTSKRVGIADMFAARKDAGWEENTWNEAAHKQAVAMAEKGVKFKGDQRSGGEGFMAKAVGKLKRTRLMKNYTMRVVFTQRFKVNGELYSHGTPVIVIRARRLGRYARKPKGL